jgi:TrpR-related protein YerC/YecD
LTISLYFDKVLNMQDSADMVWKTDTARQFADVLTAIDDAKTMQNFLRDAMTEKEIIEIGARLKAAQMLQQGKRYTEIIETTKLSSRTVARISDWMQHGCNGYAAALKLTSTHHDHIPPARA